MKRFLLSFLLVSSSLVAQKPHDAARWIDDLKKAPAYELGTGLPHENFAGWFADLVKPAEVGYRVEQCGVYNAANGDTEQLFCVVAYTKPPHPGWRRWFQLSFIVGSKPSQGEAATAPEGNRVDFMFLRGIEAPANPRIARPDHIFSELSELEAIVRDSHPSSTADLGGPPT